MVLLTPCGLGFLVTALTQCSTNMPASFHNTLGALAQERRRGYRGLLTAVIVSVALGLWLSWFVYGSVPMYVASQSARLQSVEEVHPTDVHVSGRVVSVHLNVGEQVHEGQILLELDATDTRLQLDAANARERGLRAQIDALDVESEARQQAIAAATEAGQAQVSQAAALHRESNIRAGLAADEGHRMEKLHHAGVIAEADRMRAVATTEQSRAAAKAKASQLAVLQSSARRDLADRRADLAQLERALATLRADLRRIEVERAKLRQELERHTVRAPIAGRLGQVRAPRVGSSVKKGQTIAAITPAGSLTIVADFASADAVGRVRVGQPARLRADGFPWTQYGMVPARVTAISGEANGGLVQVRLSVIDADTSAVPIRHGITGSVEIQLQNVSPATLALRAAGGLLQ